ncbi:MBL fold metallo-hydrolase [Bacillus atrophaeus]|uniref:YtnP family quorum-quenching lactonase n=1 Tax=Bacillus atrophaeus TaxID=1452 RepID=UPI001EFC22A0|nr:MBL fold metallo-hydrolase [Bacillus atrophaeus]MCG8396605.1 MBL fold metallo-hydrolase [Bacillus atrophaeus]
METMKMGSFVFTWLDGGVTHMDGGAMFGVVPKPLWSKKYPVNEKNQIELRTDPILIQKNGLNILVDSGIGSGKMTEKQIRNYGVTEQSNIKKSLAELGLTVHDIDIIAMTHLHFDHASGLTEYQDEKLVSVFPDADIYTSSVEWNEMRHPNIRSKNTYWKENWEAVEGQVKTFDGSCMITEGITMHHTGGHSDGHSILVCEDGGETAIHMADLMPTAAHRNPLWVLAYDDYPMTSISEKQKWQAYAEEKDAWMIFYHDECYRALKWEEDGSITDSLKRTGK